jgi:nitrate reductase NapE component
MKPDFSSKWLTLFHIILTIRLSEIPASARLIRGQYNYFGGEFNCRRYKWISDFYWRGMLCAICFSKLPNHQMNILLFSSAPVLVLFMAPKITRGLLRLSLTSRSFHLGSLASSQANLLWLPIFDAVYLIQTTIVDKEWISLAIIMRYIYPIVSVVFVVDSYIIIFTFFSSFGWN